MKTMKRMLLGLSLLFCFQVSSAALVDIPLPAGSFISNYAGSGLDIAWAAPCRAIDPSCGAIDLSFQSAFGWRLATLGEVVGVLASLVATDFVFAGANVPLGGSDANGAHFDFGSPGAAAACASPYFSNRFSQCNWGNAPGSNGGLVVPWGFGQADEATFSEAIAVRGASVPEPATLTLFGLGLLAMGFGRRRKQV